MRYVLTGASGHIGNNLARYIQKQDPLAQIVVLTRRLIIKELDGVCCEQVVGDLFNETFLRAHIDENSVVVHLAGMIDLTNKKKSDCEKVNYILTKLVCDVCSDVNVKKFIYVGSVDGIAKTNPDEIIEEPKDYCPEKIKGNYGKTKAMAMGYVWSKIQQNPSFNAAMVLPSAVIGVHDYKPSAVGRVVLNTILKKPQFGLDGGYNFVDVQDVCKGIYSLITSGKRDQFILSGENVSVKELYGFINRQKGWKKKPIIFPNWLVKFVAPFTSVLSPVTVKALLEPHRYSYRKAEQELGYHPTPIEKTLQETVEWFEENLHSFR